MPFIPKKLEPLAGADCKDFEPLSKTINNQCKKSMECDFVNQGYMVQGNGCYCSGKKDYNIVIRR